MVVSSVRTCEWLVSGCFIEFRVRDGGCFRWRSARGLGLGVGIECLKCWKGARLEKLANRGLNVIVCMYLYSLVALC